MKHTWSRRNVIFSILLEMTRIRQPVYTCRVINANYDSWVRSLIWSGRPLRALRTPYVEDWEANRQDEIQDLTARGLVPLEHELDKLHRQGKLTEEIEEQAALR